MVRFGGDVIVLWELCVVFVYIMVVYGMVCGSFSYIEILLIKIIDGVLVGWLYVGSKVFFLLFYGWWWLLLVVVVLVVLVVFSLL